jgi:hypothetical protein
MIDNRSTSTVQLVDIENRGAPGSGAAVGPGSALQVNMWVPWATTAADFPVHHLELQFGSVTRFWIWQCATAEDGDHVRFSIDGAWHDHGRPVHGVSAVDAVSGDRTMVVRDTCLELTAMPTGLASVVRTALGTGGYRLSGQYGPRQVPSVPKSFATAFSMAGPPSDAFAKGTAGAQWLYRDEGKRYSFALVNGVVVATEPDGTQTRLTTAVSYSSRRAGQMATAPMFDLIAANGGRVFAKQQGLDQFYFATMDQMSIGVADDGHAIAVPSNYFKLDPEFNQPGAVTAALTGPFEGCFGGHPGAQRFPLFQFALAQNLIDMMMVLVKPRVWHLIDARPPLGVFNLEVLAIKTVLDSTALSVLEPAPVFQEILALVEQAILGPDISPPAHTPAYPTYPAVSYTTASVSYSLPSIDFDLVLDIGVGHAHWHEQYEGVTGGELQPLRTGPLVPSPPVTYADLYRFANGPVRDGDGYIDGTCNYYALVRLRGGGYALLYLDEQSYFVQRWRMVDPRDAKGLTLALATDLNNNPGLYGWNPAAYWCPFRAGQIAANSRLAVSRQVLLVTAPDLLNTNPARPTAVIYSINFSYATMDRSWRWRSVPIQAEYFTSDSTREQETIDPTQADRVYPETVRLREDMTINLKGTQQEPDGTIMVGRWYQRYLPAGNTLVPPPAALTGNRPAAGYNHRWKFLPEAVFQAADHFSRFGVYDAADARTQYFPVTPATAADAQALANGQRDPAPWVDGSRQLCTRLLEYQWAAPLRPPDVDLGQTLWNLQIVGPPRSPASLFNLDTRMRIVKRGTTWTAQPWDKRDDDLFQFWGLPKTVTLTKSGRSATVTLQPQAWVDYPPAVPAAQFTWTGNPRQPVLITLTGPVNVWRARIAALDPVPSLSAPTATPAVVNLLDVELKPRFTAVGGNVQFAWAPTARIQATLAQYCTTAGALTHGTSMWFEDLVGHVSVPDTMTWSGTPPAPAISGTLWDTTRNPDGSWAAAANVNDTIGVTGTVTAVAAASSAPGQVQVLYATAGGAGLWHTISQPGGTWTNADDLRTEITFSGLVAAVAAVSSEPGLAEFIFASADGGLWSTFRLANGTWAGYNDLKAIVGDPGTVVAVAAASSQTGEAQYLFATADGGLWHTIAQGGTWTGLGDVKGQIGNPGVVVAVAAAGAGPGVSQFMFATADGGLWHTIRQANGTWTGLGNVKGQIGDPGPVVAVSATASAANVVQFMFATADGGLWHTIRQANGTWTGLGNVKGQIGDPGAISAVTAASSAAGQAQFLFA